MVRVETDSNKDVVNDCSIVLLMCHVRARQLGRKECASKAQICSPIVIPNMSWALLLACQMHRSARRWRISLLNLLILVFQVKSACIFHILSEWLVHKATLFKYWECCCLLTFPAIFDSYISFTITITLLHAPLYNTDIRSSLGD